jgi:RNA polymerase sigma-70 factor, ECF subfamily
VLISAENPDSAEPIGVIGGLDHRAQEQLDFSGIYEQNRGKVRAVLYQIAGDENLEDLVQEAFVRIWKGLAGYRRDAKLSSWIYRISVNTALDHLRSRSRQKESQVDHALDGATSNSDQHRDCETRDLVLKGLMGLNKDHRAVLVLSLIHEIPLYEVAEILEIPEGTVKSRLHNAKHEFRKVMSNYGVEI